MELILPIVFMVGVCVGAFLTWLTLKIKPAQVPADQPAERLSPGVGGTPQ